MRFGFILSTSGILATIALQTALAEQRPFGFPTRDAIITYRTVLPGGHNQLSQTEFLAAELVARITPHKFSDLYLLIDYRQRIALTVYNGSPSSYLETPFLPQPKAIRSDATHVVMGYDCTIWNTLPSEVAAASSSCVTDDGLVLQTILTTAGQQIIVQAIEIDLRKQDKSRFRLPVGAIRK